MSKKQNLNLSVEVTFKDGHKETFDSPELAANATGLSEASIKSRCSREGTGKKDGIFCRWADEHTRKSKQAKRNKNKGNNYELQIIRELTELGYSGLKSSRSQNRNLDNGKIDIAETEDSLSCYIQCKATKNTPNVEKINEDCSFKDRPLAVFWKKQNRITNNLEFVIIPKNYFYNLIQKYDEKINN